MGFEFKPNIGTEEKALFLSPKSDWTNPGQFSAFIDLGWKEISDLRSALLEDIKEDLERKLEEGNEDLRVDLGVILDLMGNTGKSMAELEEAEANRDEDAHYPLGKIYFRQKKALIEKEKEEADSANKNESEGENKGPSWTSIINQFQKAIKRDPNNIPAQYYLGKALSELIQQESTKDVIDAFTRYLSAGSPIGQREEVQQFLNAQDPELQKRDAKYRGKEALKKGDYLESIAAFEDAIRLGDKEAFYHQGIAFQKVGNLPRAVDSFRAAKDFSKEIPNIDDNILKEAFSEMVVELYKDLNLLQEGIENLPIEFTGAIQQKGNVSESTIGKELGFIMNTISGATNQWKRVYKTVNCRAAVFSLALSPTTNHILAGLSNHQLATFDLTGKKLQEFVGHEEAVKSVCFSPDGNYIVSGSQDDSIRLWDLEGNTLQVFKGHKGDVLEVCFSPDGKLIASASKDNTVRLWNLKGEQISILNGHTWIVYTLAFSPDGKMLLTGSGDETIKLWDVSTAKELWTQDDHCGDVNSVRFSPDGQYILSGSDDHTAILWTVEGERVSSFTGHAERINEVIYHPEGNWIITASDDDTTRIWDRKGELLQVLRGHVEHVESLAISPDGQYLVTASLDRQMMIWSHPQTQWEEIKSLRDAN